MIAALRYEWMRIISIRSTYWLTATTLVIGAGISTLISWGFSDTAAGAGIAPADLPGVAPGVVTQAAAFGPPYIVAFLMAIVGVLAWGHEYRHGMIRATFTAVPSRTAIWLSKYVVTLLWVAVSMVLTFVASSIAGWLFLSDNGISFTSRTVFETEGRALLVGVLLTMFAMSITAILRHQTAALVLLFIWPLVIESIISIVFVVVPSLRDHTALLHYLPFRAMGRMIQLPGFTGDGPFSADPLTLTQAGLVFGGYVLAAVVASLVLLRSRDA